LESRLAALSELQGETLDHLAEAVAVFGTDGRLRLFNPVFADIWRLSPNALKAEPHIGEIIANCEALNADNLMSGTVPNNRLGGVYSNSLTLANDNNTFIGAIAECGAAGLSTLGQGSPCRDQYGNQFRHDIRHTTYPALVKALKAVHRHAPHARVAILGYLWILPRTEGCFDKMPVAKGDVPYLRRVQATLNDAVRRAAAVAGATYVDMSRVSEGHDACQPIGTRWIEPVLQGTNPVVVHPNALGERHLAKRTMRVLHLG